MSERKYCSCIAKTAAKQSKACLDFFGKKKSGKSAKRPTKCYNPYALCGRIQPSGRGRMHCARDVYDYESMSPELVRAVLRLHGKTALSQLRPAASATSKSKRMQRMR